MSTQATPIKVVQSLTYGTATKGATKEMSYALAGGSAVDDYFVLRAQAGSLLNGILNNRGFINVANLGEFRAQHSYFYSEGNSDVLTSFTSGDAYNSKLYDCSDIGAFLAFQLGRDVGQITYFKITAGKEMSGPASVFHWKDLASLILKDLGRSATQAFGGVKSFLENNNIPGKKGSTAKKAIQRSLYGAAAGLEGSTEFQTPNGNIVHFDLTHNELEALNGISQIVNCAALPQAQDDYTHGISHALVIQNHTGFELNLRIIHQNKESDLLIGPGDIYKGTSVPAFVKSGEEIGISGIEAHRSLCGEASTLMTSNTPEGSIAYTIELDILGTHHKIVAGFDLPQLSKNSSFLLFNPSGTGEEIFNNNVGRSSELAKTLTHADIGVTLAHNSTSTKTSQLSTGKKGYFYRSLLAIYDKTAPPQKAGLTALDGLLFGNRV